MKKVSLFLLAVLCMKLVDILVPSLHLVYTHFFYSPKLPEQWNSFNSLSLLSVGDA